MFGRVREGKRGEEEREEKRSRALPIPITPQTHRDAHYRDVEREVVSQCDHEQQQHDVRPLQERVDRNGADDAAALVHETCGGGGRARRLPLGRAVPLLLLLLLLLSSSSSLLLSSSSS